MELYLLFAQNIKKRWIFSLFNFSIISATKQTKLIKPKKKKQWF